MEPFQKNKIFKALLFLPNDGAMNSIELAAQSE